MKREQEEKVPQTYKSDPERLAEKVQYRIDGEIKYFCLADGSRQIRGDATDCEMKLWAECLRLMAEREWVKVSPETKDSSHKNIESLRRQDGTIYARKCLDCGATWKIYQKPCHSSPAREDQDGVSEELR